MARSGKRRIGVRVVRCIFAMAVLTIQVRFARGRLGMRVEVGWLRRRLVEAGCRADRVGSVTVSCAILSAV